MTAPVFLGLLVGGAGSGGAWLRGSTSGTRLLDLEPFVDPLAALETVLATGHVTQTVLLGAGLLVGVGVRLGPVFCGWIYPLGWVLDPGQEIRVFGLLVLGRGRPRRAPDAVPPSVRIVVLGLYLGTILVVTLPIFQTLSPINLFVRALIFGATAGLLGVFARLVVGFSFPRVWCRSLCPLGGLHPFLG